MMEEGIFAGHPSLALPPPPCFACPCLTCPFPACPQPARLHPAPLTLARSPLPAHPCPLILVNQNCKTQDKMLKRELKWQNAS